MPKQVKAGLSLMPTEDFLECSNILFDLDEVEVLEWSFDTVWPDTSMPDWCIELLDQFSQNENLIGHGVYFSPFSIGTNKYQQEWLERLKEECTNRNYNHISEHFGFMSGGEFQKAAPLPVPMNEQTIEQGVNSLRAISEASNRRVGLENLALAFSLEDVENQGRFLDQVLESVDGFLLLDLHNLYCQSVNFEIPASELLESYPLDRVRELHISGGSWSKRMSNPQKSIRRDTHDGAVPSEVFELLNQALSLCPNTEYVILERLGGTMGNPQDPIEFSDDYHKMLEITNGWSN